MLSGWTGLYFLIHEYVNPAAKALANYSGKVIHNGVLLFVRVQLDLWYKKADSLCICQSRTTDNFIYQLF